MVEEHKENTYNQSVDHELTMKQTVGANFYDYMMHTTQYLNDIDVDKASLKTTIPFLPVGDFVIPSNKFKVLRYLTSEETTTKSCGLDSFNKSCGLEISMA